MQLAPCNTKTEPKQHCTVVRANYDNKTPHNMLKKTAISVQQKTLALQTEKTRNGKMVKTAI